METRYFHTQSNGLNFKRTLKNFHFNINRISIFGIPNYAATLNKMLALHAFVHDLTQYMRKQMQKHTHRTNIPKFQPFSFDLINSKEKTNADEPWESGDDIVWI